MKGSILSLVSLLLASASHAGEVAPAPAALIPSVIHTPAAPPPGNYSQGRLVDLGSHLLLHTAGQTGNEPRADTVVEGGIGPQTRQALENIRAIVEASGGGIEHVAKVTVFMKDMAASKAGFEQAYGAFFDGAALPARSLVEVSEIPLPSEPTVVEIEAVAYIPKKGQPPPSREETVARLRKAFAEQPREELARTIALASLESPREYRAALRDALEGFFAGVPRLQRHLTALDENGDGKVSPGESYRTLRALGFGRVKAFIIASGAQAALLATTGRVTGLSIAVDGGSKGLHRAVDTGAMDPAQDLEKKLDEFMAEDLDHDGWIGMSDVGRLIDKRAGLSKANRFAKMIIKAANKAEFAALFDRLGRKMNREDVRDFYTSSLFFSLLPPDALAQRIVGLRRRKP